jgi:hypothetical protein
VDASALEDMRRAAADLGGPTPYLDRALASILAAWLASVASRSRPDELPPDWDYALEVAQYSAARRA